MISAEAAQLLARYNAWQNGSVLEWASKMSDEERRLDRGAFWGSVMGTMNHLLWGDTAWMHRLAGGPPVSCGLEGSPNLHAEWEALCVARREMDEAMLRWTEGLTDEDLAGTLTWTSISVGRTFEHSRGMLTLHMFNHATHHRGQLHAMATAAGFKPGATDLPFMDVGP